MSVNVKTAYGAMGDGIANDTAAINNAIISGAPVYFPAGTYLYDPSGIALAFGQILSGDGPIASVIKKNSNGDMFTANAGSGLSMIGLNGAAPLTGRGVVVSAHVNELVFVECYIQRMDDYCIEFTAASAGTESHIVGGIYERQDYSLPAIRLPNDGGVASPRIFTGVKSGGVLLDLNAADNTMVTGCWCRNIVFGTSAKSVVVGSRLASLGAPVKLSGIDNLVVGCTVGGNIELQLGLLHSTVSGCVAAGYVNNSGNKTNKIEDAVVNYTPIWNAATTPPSIGNGVISGTYCISGRAVTVEIALVMGSTTTYGTGVFQFSLPIPPLNGNFVGVGRATNAAANANPLLEGIPIAASEIEMHMYDGTAVNGSTYSWAAGDTITISTTYLTA